MTRFFSKLYFFILLILLYKNSNFFLQPQLKLPEFISFARVLNFFPYDPVIFPAVYFLAVLFILLAMFSSWRVFRFFAGIFFLVSFSMKYSFGKINHSYHMWMMTLPFFCFLNLKNGLIKQPNLLLIRTCQGLILTTYFISGLWKVRNLWGHNIFAAANDNIAYAVAEGGGPSNYLKNILFFDNPALAGYGLLLVIIFQISCVVPLLIQKRFIVWGFLILGFHYTTGIIMGIWFKEMAWSAFFFLILFEIMAQFERKNNI